MFKEANYLKQKRKEQKQYEVKAAWSQCFHNSLFFLHIVVLHQHISIISAATKDCNSSSVGNLNQQLQFYVMKDLETTSIWSTRKSVWLLPNIFSRNAFQYSHLCSNPKWV